MGGVNPYQPVVLDAVSEGDDLPCEVSFRMTYALLYHAESQYLLHWHPSRLLFASLAMIGISCVGFWWSIRLGTIPFLITLAAMMVGSAVDLPGARSSIEKADSSTTARIWFGQRRCLHGEGRRRGGRANLDHAEGPFRLAAQVAEELSDEQGNDVVPRTAAVRLHSTARRFLAGGL